MYSLNFSILQVLELYLFNLSSILVIPILSLISYTLHKEDYVFIDSDSDIEDI